MRKRMLSLLCIFALLVGLMPTMAFAADADSLAYGDGLCEHHTQHDESCDYTEGTAEIPCSHEHTEDCYTFVTECVHEHTAECYPAESVSENTATLSEPEEAEPTECTHECSEESGCITKTSDCKHEHKVNGGEADREGGLGRDETCGYVPATAGTPCTFVCEVCNPQDSGDVSTPSDAQPEECTCETLCTEEEINADCPVCSAEGAEIDKVCVGAAPMLPVTALAAGDVPGTLYVGETQITGSGYWKTTDDGKLEPGSESDYNVYYDGNGTLTLNSATIKGDNSATGVPYGAGIYAHCNNGKSVALTIELIGTNTITGNYGIYVDAQQGETVGTNASLLIRNSSDNGILEVSGSSHGIFVKSGTGDASLNINDASVVAKTTQTYSGGYAGVYVQSSAYATSSPQLSLAVNGGSLTTSASEGNDGIQFNVGSSSDTTNATTSLTVSNNAIVRAENGIKAERVDKPTPSGTGIVFDGTEGTVYGEVELQNGLEIKSGETLTIPEGSSLNGNGKLTNNGTIIVKKGGNLTGDPGGKVVYAPAITTHPKNVEVKENETATFTVEATGTDLSYQWQQSTDNGSNWTNITDETNTTYTTGKTTMDMNGWQYRCVVTGYGTAAESNAATLTVQKSTTPIEPKYVRYIVEHYKQNADGSYTLADTEQPIDEIGKTVTATPKTYEGYTYNPNAAGTVVSGTLKEISSPDDIVTLKLYYDITLYTVTVNGSYAQTTGAGSYAKDATVTINAGTRSGYTFDGWTSADGVTFANAGSAQTTFTMPDKAVTVTANWKKNSGGGSSDPTYSVTLPGRVEGGTVTANKRYAEAGETFRFTALPDKGWVLDTLTVTDNKGNEIDLTDQDNNEYTFKMPARSVTVTAVFIRDGIQKLPFTDVAEHAWYADAVAYVYEHGLMAGTSDTAFSPDATTSRSMIATILWRMAGSPVVNYAMDYTDVAQGQWYSEAIRWAASEGIVGGYGNGLFGTNDPITREQFAAMLYRFAQEQGYDVSIGENTNILSYTDVADLSEYAISAMQWAVGVGIINGTSDGSTLSPQGQATRAQAAVMLMRFCEEYVTW